MPRKHIFTIAFFFCLLLSKPFNVAAQHYSNTEIDTTRNKGWWFGFNMGTYFANSHSANFYNGTKHNPNNVGFVLDNKYRYEEILLLLNSSMDVENFVWAETDLPTNMHYKPAINIGGIITYNFNNKTGVFFQFNFTKLNAKDVFVIEINTHQDYILRRDRLFAYSIYGVEERVNIDVGLRKMWPISSKVQIATNFGLNINDTEVKESQIRIEDRSYSIINQYGSGVYVPGTVLQEYDVRFGGIGIGFFVEPSLQYIINENFSLDPGISLYFTDINLPGYEKMKLQFSPFLRFSVNGVIW